ncbi:MAG: PEGA domain-containing protein [Candidatus Omnitrophota bacterium]|jgi:hypothetical protein
MSGEQKIRSALYYLSVFIFLVGLPFIISFALGYKFDRRSFKFTKTGLILIKTQPSGASVFFDNMLLGDKTPVTINELLPGTYAIRMELSGHYPYFSNVTVEEGKVTRLEKVILFPLRADVKKLNKEVVTYFFIDEPKGAVYYVNDDERSVYKSDMDGTHFDKIADFQAIFPVPKKWKHSPDREKLLYYNTNQIGIVTVSAGDKLLSGQEQPFIINYAPGGIIEAYWHSDSYHIVLVTYSKIEIVEAKTNSIPVPIINLNKRNTSSFYDLRADTVYFLDSQKANDGLFYDNVYKLELNAKLYPFQEFMKLAPTFEKAGVKQYEKESKDQP